MKKRKMSAHIDIGIRQVLKKMYKVEQKQTIFLDMVRFMREQLGIRRRTRRRMWLYLERTGKL